MTQLRASSGAGWQRAVVGAVVGMAAVGALTACASSAAVAGTTTSPLIGRAANTNPRTEDETTTTSAQHVRRCTAGDLTTKLVPHGGEASQTFSILVLTDATTTACSISGYVSITATGHAGSGANRLLPTKTSHGTYFRPDPGPAQVVLNQGRSASCVVETQTAYASGANPATITELRISPPGATASDTIRVNLGATEPPGGPIPIDITALVSGTSGPKQ